MSCSSSVFSLFLAVPALIAFLTNHKNEIIISYINLRLEKDGATSCLRRCYKTDGENKAKRRRRSVVVGSSPSWVTIFQTARAGYTLFRRSLSRFLFTLDYICCPWTIKYSVVSCKGHLKKNFVFLIFKIISLLS